MLGKFADATVLPEFVAKESPKIIGAIIESMQNALTRDAHLPNIPYCSLLLKLGAADLTREFVAAFEVGATSAPENQSLPRSGLSLEMMNDEAEDPSEKTMHQSSGLFEQLRANFKRLGIEGVEAFAKDAFLVPLRQGLIKSRFDEPNVVRLMPYACKALDVELVLLYRRISTLTQGTPAGDLETTPC